MTGNKFLIEDYFGSIMICLKAPAPAMVNNSMVMLDIASLKIMILDILRLRRIPRK